MKIDARALNEGQSVSFSCELNMPELNYAGRVSFCRPVAVTGTVRKKDGILTLNAGWRVWAGFICDRCNAPFSRLMAGQSECMLIEGDSGEREDIAPMTGGFCDIDEVLTPAVILSVESKNLCISGCEGNAEWLSYIETEV